MTTFLDGPAKGKTLMLRRTPKYLRVVVDQDGAVDALDQLEDAPRPDERVFAYILQENKGSVHLNMGRGRGGFYTLAGYKLISPQPDDTLLRANAAWRRWTVETDQLTKKAA
jgi:hypothetical protein